MLVGSIGTLLLAYPIYHVYIVGNAVAIILANLLMGVLCSLYRAPKNAVLTQLFPAEVCYTGFGLAHNIGLAIAGIVPVILIKLVTTQHMLFAPAYYFMLSSVVVTICLIILYRIFTAPQREL
jgi:MHS family proline/betaine transporter-like MFS transporter